MIGPVAAGGPPFDATAFLHAYAWLRLPRLRGMDPAATQERLLLDLVRRAAGTRFGRAHGFDAVRSVADFQARVPLRRYEAFWEEWWRDAWPVLEGVTWPGRVPWLALSSGTTSGRTKYIPVTPEMMQANRDAALDVMCWHLAAHPRSRIFGGFSFMLGGSTALEEVAPGGGRPGVRQGDLSGIAAAEVPPWFRPWSFPPREIALLADWDRKIEALVEATPVRRISVLSGTPSWVLMLLDRMGARHGRPPLPALELLVHGGVAWAPYRERTAPYLPRGCATREVYPASEGFVAIADRGDGEGMRLNLDQGCFFEFVPVAELDAAAPTRHWAATVETGVDYAVVVSSCAGLWAYVLGDTVRFLDRAPPRLVVTGRTSYTLSAFGEHLVGEEIEAAAMRAAREAGLALAEYSVGPVFAGATGHHHWLIEPAAAEAPPEAAGRMAEAIDAALRAANDDYRAHREGRQLDPPAVTILPPGAFTDWMRAEGRLGGQNKVPRVVADPARFAAMAAAVAERGQRPSPGSGDAEAAAASRPTK